MIFFVDTSSDSEFMTGSTPIYHFIRDNPERYFLLNYMSGYSIGNKLSNLFPPFEMEKVFKRSETEFMQTYTTYLLYNKEVFIDIMEIMMSEYYGGDVIVFTDLSVDILMVTTDLICDFIYKRYSEHPIIVKTLYDLLNYDDQEMDQYHHQIFMNDKEFYTIETVDVKDLQNNIGMIEDMNGSNI